MGDRLALIKDAVVELQALLGAVKVSPLYETAPMYVTDQPPFLNGMAFAQTSLGPLEVLRVLKRIEVRVGRLPRQRFGPREIDLDLICYGSLQYTYRDKCPQSPGSSDLTIPHPRLNERRFVLQPLSDLCPNLELPGLGCVKELLSATKDQEPSVLRVSDGILPI